MLTSLCYRVEFPSTGRLFDNHIEFEPGLTAIIGRNESGKSLIIEMIAYCIFGKSALRGAASDYKNLTAELKLTVFGKKLEIFRRPKGELLLIDGVEVAVGADAINKTMPQLLGFGLDVFNVALVAMQDELNDFTKMKPTARAKMVDDLTGMMLLDTVDMECKAEAKQHKQMAEAVVLNMVQPVEPVKPVNYVSSEKIQNKLTEAYADQVTRNVALRTECPPKPLCPVRPSFSDTLEELEEYQSKALARANLRQSLESQIQKIPEPESTKEQLETYSAFVDYNKQVAMRGPQTQYTLDDLSTWKEWHTGTKAKCPKCDTEFVVGSTVSVEHEPVISLAEVNTHLNYLNNWKQPLKEISYDGPNFDLVKETIAHSRAEEKAALGRELQNSPPIPDRSEDLQLIRNYDKLFTQFQILNENYKELLENYEKAKLLLTELPDNSEYVKALELSLKEFSLYEHQVKDYIQRKSQYDLLTLRLKEERDAAEGFGLGAKAIKNTRLRVKRELAPLISSSASMLLYNLTDGERQNIVVDEDFNVWVDGQPLQTLSGSGKAVVNLALRIGMGQVLTAKVLSIFIGDEIDGSMDQVRATATHQTFNRLAESIDQVILITHKDISADHIISV